MAFSLKPAHSGDTDLLQVGFMAVDQIAKQEGTRIEKKLSKAAVARCKFGGHSILLAKPLTYMNLSGESVKGLAQFYKVCLPILCSI